MPEPVHDHDSLPTIVTDSEFPSTFAAPPFRELVVPAAPGPLMGLPAVGQTLDDFILLRLLGSGSFARVFLARQVSLDRLVALKVSVNRGQEARTLASLEHDHIVRVFSEVVDPGRDLRMLCMQYVPGTTLERIIEALASRHEGGRAGGASPLSEQPASASRSPQGTNAPRSPTGQDILAIIDAQASDPAALDLAALRDRELLADLDFIEAGCWMGARLAEALAHAHRVGVLHRDVKPANILVNRYGRPLLVDFNVAARAPEGASGGHESEIGGTLTYMSPEHLEAFHRILYGGPPVDARSDVWSLGVVLYELFAGRLPFVLPAEAAADDDILPGMIARRRAGPPPLPAEVDAPMALQRVLDRCLAPRPEDRFQNAAELAEALESCRELRRVERDLPRGGLLTRLALQQPFLVATVLLLLPHILGSIVNITYNFFILVLTEPQQKELFPKVVLVYNLVVYPLAVFLFLRQAVPVIRTWKRLSHPGPIDPEEVLQARRRALGLPWWLILASCLGWLPGGFVFPLVLQLFTKTEAPYLKFLFSFTVSGLIALTYSVLALEFIVVRVLYPGLWLDARALRSTARVELEREEGRVAALQFLAVLIPVAGASLLLSVGPDDLTGPFRLLVTGLLAVGMAGLGLTMLARSELRKAVAALVAPARSLFHARRIH
jgi:serine/threonine protein kinase